ncbi:MAG: 7TM diverse intracellular signaling domain-containing protein, partial [Pseudobdellovibrionaceae bacterium]
SQSSRWPMFRIDLAPKETKTFFIKHYSHHNVTTKIFVSKLGDFQAEESNAKAILFFYLGGILCLIAYNLFIGVYTRDVNYFLYILFAGALCVVSLNTQGFFDAYVFSRLPWTLTYYLKIFTSLAILASLVFVFQFLNASQVLPRLKFGFWAFGLSATVTLILGFFPNLELQEICGAWTDLTSNCLLFFLLFCGYLAYRRGHKLVQFYLLSGVWNLFGVIAWFGLNYGWLEGSGWTPYSLLIGSMGEMLVLSLGLAYKINILDQEKRQALLEANEKERYHRLVRVLSHDVSNAILIFSGYVHRLKRFIQGSRESEILNKLELSLGNMTDMLGLVRNEEAFKSFQLSVVLRPLDLHEVVNEIVSFYEDQFQSKGLRVHTDVPEKSLIMADRTALANQVLSNLIANSIKFSYPESEIRIFLEEKAEMRTLKIQDHGCGIPADNIKRIFYSEEVISRAGTIKERGSGIGTSLVKDYMKIFNGQIEVESVHESVSSRSGTLISLHFPKC